jgi:ribonuclease HI
MDIYTDGGCRENPGGIGAWAFVAVERGNVIHAASGADPATTNNRMELQAVIEAMRWANGQTLWEATIHTDSDLTVRCGNRQWKRKKNLDLWQQFDNERQPNFVLRWVRGHNGNRWNESADRACGVAMDALTREMVGTADAEMDARLAHLLATD